MNETPDPVKPKLGAKNKRTLSIDFIGGNRDYPEFPKLGEKCTTVDTKGTGATNYTRAMTVFLFFIPSRNDTTTCTHRDGNDHFLAELFTGFPPG